MKFSRRKCPFCREWFLPQPHNAYHQHYCTQPACRRASKRHSQRRWLRRNADQNRGPENVLRVRTWREDHPGYWRNAWHGHHLRADLFIPASRIHRHLRLKVQHLWSGALQEVFLPQPSGSDVVTPWLVGGLQDLIGGFLPQYYVGAVPRGR